MGSPPSVGLSIRCQVVHQPRIAADRRGGTFERDMPAVHDIGMARDLERKLDVLLDQDQRHLPRKLFQAPGDLLDHADPDALGRLVEHQEPRPAEHGAADRQHLALAARQGAGGLLQALGELGEEIEHVVHARAVGLADAAQQEVLAHRELGEDGMLLRHVADAAPHALLGALAFDRGAVEMDRARHRRQLAEQGFQQRRLARAVAAQHGDRAARRHLQRHAEQRLAAAVARAQRPATSRKACVRHGW